jgi:hypothetical protein
MSKASVDKIIDVHLSEYDVLNTRCAYFINLQIVVLIGVVTSFVVMLTVFYSHVDLLLDWWPLLTFQIFANLSANMFYEQYRIVRYIELKLKPIIIELTQDNRIWGNEAAIIKERNKHVISSTTFWENIGIILIGSMLLIISLYVIKQKSLFHLGPLDITGFCVNLLLFGIYSYRMRGAIQQRKVYK